MNFDTIVELIWDFCKTATLILVCVAVLAITFMMAFNATNLVVFTVSNLTYGESFATLLVVAVLKYL